MHRDSNLPFEMPAIAGHLPVNSAADPAFLPVRIIRLLDHQGGMSFPGIQGPPFFHDHINR
jgi:hypothetical protein